MDVRWAAAAIGLALAIAGALLLFGVDLWIALVGGFGAVVVLVLALFFVFSSL